MNIYFIFLELETVETSRQDHSSEYKDMSQREDIILKCEDLKIPFQVVISLCTPLSEYILMGLSFAALDINKKDRRKKENSIWRKHFACSYSCTHKNRDKQTDLISAQDIENININIRNEEDKIEVKIRLTKNRDLNKKWFSRAIKELALHQVMHNFEMI